MCLLLVHFIYLCMLLQNFFHLLFYVVVFLQKVEMAQPSTSRFRTDDPNFWNVCLCFFLNKFLDIILKQILNISISSIFKCTSTIHKYVFILKMILIFKLLLRKVSHPGTFQFLSLLPPQLPPFY